MATTAVRIPADARESVVEFDVPPETDTVAHFGTLAHAVDAGTGSPVDVHRWFPHGVDDPFWRNYVLYANDRGPELGWPRNDRLLGSGIFGPAVLLGEDAVCRSVRPRPDGYEPLPPVSLANHESVLRDIAVHFT